MPDLFYIPQGKKHTPSGKPACLSKTLVMHRLALFRETPSALFAVHVSLNRQVQHTMRTTNSHLAVSTREDASLLKGVLSGDDAALFWGSCPAATVMPRLSLDDSGDAGVKDRTRWSIIVVVVASTRVVGMSSLSFSEATATRFTTVRLPLGEGVGLEAPPRFTETFLGDNIGSALDDSTCSRRLSFSLVEGVAVLERDDRAGDLPLPLPAAGEVPR